jgi:hypothetical protein
MSCKAPPFPGALADLAGATRGFLGHEEGLALYEYAYRAGRACIGPLVEIGSYCGKSTVYLGAGAEAAGATLICVDHHQGSEEMQAGWAHHDPGLADPETGLLESLPLWRSTVKKAGFRRVVGMIGESSVVASVWACPVSMLFIDGGHGRGPAWSDYRNWGRFVAVDGYLAIHDVFERDDMGGSPPFEIYRHALDSGHFRLAEAVDSLRILVRVVSRPGVPDPLPPEEAGPR